MDFGSEDMTIAIVLLLGIGMVATIIFVKDRKHYLSREYVLLCDSTTIIWTLGKYKNESDNFYAKIVLNNGAYLLHCSGSHLQDYTFVVRFINYQSNEIMTVSPTDKLTNHGGAEYHYIMKLDLFMKQYAKF